MPSYQKVLSAACAGCITAIATSALPANADGSNAPIGAAVADLPIFDAHIHYKKPAWDAYSPEQIITLMDNSGVAMGLVSSSPDEGTIMLLEHAPKRVVPELRPYHGRAGSSNWTSVAGMAEYLEERLDAHPHEGIGEFHIRNRVMWDETLFKKIMAMAKARDLYLHVHAGSEPIRWLYDLDPDVKIIWAHAGLGETANEVYLMMAEYPELLADTSLREYGILAAANGLNPDWEKIIFEFQDRLMIGSDTWVNDQWDSYEEIIDRNREWLSYLPREVAEKIAYKNAERFFGRSITNDLIGKR